MWHKLSSRVRYFCSPFRGLSIDSTTKSVDLKIDSSLTWYSCGPTVYDVAHLGHARTYVCSDIIRRILSDHQGISVKFAMGMTDIDDKIITKGKDRGFGHRDEYSKMTRYYEDLFWTDMSHLNVQRPNAILRVTEHIPEILQFIQNILDSGYAYIADDGVYFDVSKWETHTDNYDCFGMRGIPQDDEPQHQIGGDNVVYNGKKKNPMDFALWKVTGTTNDISLPIWHSPWGYGRPGWHIECSAMTFAYFGAHVDIHSGGIDLQFPHHTNEIAQCESHNLHLGLNISGKKWVSRWIHTGHLHIQGRKMSKSLKNFISIQQFLSSDITDSPADDFRLFCLQYRYRTALTYSSERIEEAAGFRKKIVNFCGYVDTLLTADASNKENDVVNTSCKPSLESSRLEGLLGTVQQQVELELRNDFNTPTVLLLFSELVGQTVQYMNLLLKEKQQHPLEPVLAVREYVLRLLDMLGCRFAALLRVNGVNSSSSSGSSNRNNEEEQKKASAVVGLLVEQRAIVRSLALKMLKANPENKELKDLLSTCDQTRRDLNSLGIELEDLPGGISNWKVK
mmetsp:Transcript_32892/g.47520  ORF Transcript_32892/g.47520 Transcript_32892/m.47520 type:complete len:565 (+) Transcript_32892:1898-3592(+)